MSGLDAAWLGLDAPDNRLTVTAVLRLAGRVDERSLAETLRTRLVEPYPTFRRRIERTRFGAPRWVEDEAFDLARHVLRLDGPPVDDDVLAAVVGDLLSRPFDLRHSPWAFHVVPQADGRDTLVVRIHHCVADGMALAAVLVGLTDRDDQGRVGAGRVDGGTTSVSAAAPADGRHAAGRIAEHRRRRRPTSPLHLGVAVVVFVVRLLSMRPVRGSRLRLPLSTAKAVAWSPGFGVPALLAAAREAGCTVNDVLLGAVAGALRTVLAQGGEKPQRLGCVVPVDLREPGRPVSAGLGNRFGLALVHLPAGEAKRAARLSVMRGQVRRAAAREAAATHVLLTALSMLPLWALRGVAGILGARCPVVVTTVRGPEHLVRLAGTTVEDVVFWVPQAGPVGLGISVFSYAGQVSVGVAADRNVVPDPAALVAAVAAELAHLGVARRSRLPPPRLSRDVRGPTFGDSE